MNLQPLAEAHLEFAFECLKELRGQANYSLAQFRDYVRDARLIGHPEHQLFVGEVSGSPMGLLTCNRFAMPRYLGFGYELEEVIVSAANQDKGYGQLLIDAFLKRVGADPTVRKVSVKTDDEARAGKVYRKFFAPVHTTVYSKPINRL